MSSWLSLATVGVTDTINNIAQQGVSLGNIAPAAIWAIVALVSVIGLVKLYVDKAKDDIELKAIIKDTTQAITNNTATLEKLNESIDRCPRK